MPYFGSYAAALTNNQNAKSFRSQLGGISSN